MSMIELVQAREQDLEELTSICIRSFHTDVECGAPTEEEVNVGSRVGRSAFDERKNCLYGDGSSLPFGRRAMR